MASRLASPWWRTLVAARLASWEHGALTLVHAVRLQGLADCLLSTEGLTGELDAYWCADQRNMSFAQALAPIVLV